MRRRALAVLSIALALSAAATPGAAGVLPDLPGMDMVSARTSGADPDGLPDETASGDAPTPADEPAQGTRTHDGPDIPSPSPSPEAASGRPDPDPAPAVGGGILDTAWRIHYVRPASTFSGGSGPGCPDAPTCDAYRVGRSRWATDATGAINVPYRYNDAGRPSSAPSAAVVRSAVADGAAEWNRWNSNLTFADAGTTDAAFNARGSDGGCADGTNVVTWRTMPADVLGITVICFDVRTFAIRDVDTAYNAALPWADLAAPDPQARVFDLRSVAVHEFGHWVSLFDLRMPKQRAQTMFASAVPGETRKRTLALGDVLGAQAAYPCGAGDRCPRTGIADD